MLKIKMFSFCSFETKLNWFKHTHLNKGIIIGNNYASLCGLIKICCLNTEGNLSISKKKKEVLTFLSHSSLETFPQSAVTTLVPFVFVHNTLPVEPENVHHVEACEHI